MTETFKDISKTVAKPWEMNTTEIMNKQNKRIARHTRST